MRQFPFKSGDRLLFQGASTVEAGRFQDPNGLGHGFVPMIKGLLAAAAPDVRLEVTNRGISGNRTVELLARWKEDCLDLHPTHLSIHVGLNDLLRQFDGMPEQTVELPAFVANYRRLLDMALASGIKHLILMEPTMTDIDLAHPSHRVCERYTEAVEALAHEYGAVWVPARKYLLAAIASGPSVGYWVPDGRHPSTAGYAVMAAAWVDAVLAPGAEPLDPLSARRRV